MRTNQWSSFILIDKLSLCGISGIKRDNGLSKHISKVVAVLSIVESDSSNLSVDLAEKFELPFTVSDNFAIERAENKLVLELNWGVDRRVHLEDLLGVSQRKVHL